MSAGEADRQQSFDKIAALINILPAKIILFAMPDRAQEKRELEHRFAHVCASPHTRTFYDAAQMVRRLALLITPDTSFIHAASCYRTKVIGLYRADAIHMSRFAPFDTAHKIICSPTYRVEDIAIEDILSAFQVLHPTKASHPRT